MMVAAVVYLPLTVHIPHHDAYCNTVACLSVVLVAQSMQGWCYSSPYFVISCVGGAEDISLLPRPMRDDKVGANG